MRWGTDGRAHTDVWPIYILHCLRLARNVTSSRSLIVVHCAINGALCHRVCVFVSGRRRRQVLSCTQTQSFRLTTTIVIIVIIAILIIIITTLAVITAISRPSIIPLASLLTLSRPSVTRSPLLLAAHSMTLRLVTSLYTAFWKHDTQIPWKGCNGNITYTQPK